jgi:hypothetical protein
MPHEAAPAVERVGAAHVARHSRCEGDGEGTRRFERGRSKHKIFSSPRPVARTVALSKEERLEGSGASAVPQIE